MADPEKIQEPGKDNTAKAAAGADRKTELPRVESPSISPAEDVPDHEPAGAPTAATQALTVFLTRAQQSSKPSWHFEMPKFAIPKITVTRRMKRRGMIAASFALAAAFGAAVGAVASQGLASGGIKTDTAGIEENQAMRKSIAHLTKEVATLKAGIEAAAKTASLQIGKTTERIDKVERAPDTTGSIGKVATSTTALAAVPVPAATPLPPVKPQIVPGWTARVSRGGIILVEGRGEIYQVSPGVPLPGLGTVESIRREGGRWVIATPKGIIVSSNAVAPPRPYYPPYYRPY